MSQHLHPYAPATSSQRPPSIAFIGWNPFQVRHILGVAQSLENRYLIIEMRHKRNLESIVDILLLRIRLYVTVSLYGDLSLDA
jgi:hypothetical protein